MPSHHALEHLISQYGYWAVLIGGIVEGDGMALLSGITAHQGLLRFLPVVGLVWLGGIIGDQGLYFAGRRWGPTLLERLGRKHAARIERLRGFIHRNGSLASFGVRFMYGLRILGPLVIGASGVPAARYVPLDLLGAAVWSLLMVSIGYGAGNLLETITADLHERRIRILMVGLAIAVMVLAIRVMFTRGERRSG